MVRVDLGVAPEGAFLGVVGGLPEQVVAADALGRLGGLDVGTGEVVTLQRLG